MNQNYMEFLVAITTSRSQSVASGGSLVKACSESTYGAMQHALHIQIGQLMLHVSKGGRTSMSKSIEQRELVFLVFDDKRERILSAGALDPELSPVTVREFPPGADDFEKVVARVNQAGMIPSAVLREYRSRCPKN